MRSTSLLVLVTATVALGACRSGNCGDGARITESRGIQAKDVPCGWNWAGEAVPTGVASTSVLLLEKMSPSVLVQNSDFDYMIRIRNISSSTTVTNVVVSDRLPGRGYEFLGATPGAENTDDTLRWAFGDLRPGEWREIDVHGYVNRNVAHVPCCASVTYGRVPAPEAPPPPPKAAPVVPPPPVAVLALTKSAPADTCLFDEIPIRLVVRNTGKAQATGVKVVDQLPDGWTVNGKPTVSFDVGALDAGASKELGAKAMASRTGRFTNTATASAAGGLTASASSETSVHRAQLGITKTASAQSLYIGRETTFTVTVTNTGDWPAGDCTVTDTMKGADAVRSVSDGGVATGASIVWKLGDLAPGASRTVTAKATRNTAGMIENTATASGHCAEPVSASAGTAYKGLSAMLVEVVDNPDPVPVGSTTEYSIAITNQGTAADADISLTADIDAGVEFVSATGDTKVTAQGGKLTFGTVATLEAKKSVRWVVVVRGTKAADSRFHLVVNTRDTQRPIEEDESTRFYE